jgi:diguanylate cyclase (GGDEF)-like protein
VPVEPVLLLLLVAVAANIVLMGAVVIPPLLGGRGLFASDGRVAARPSRTAVEFGAVIGGDPGDVHDDGVPIAAYDRVVRIVSWIFILVTSTLVAVTGLWPDSQPAIFVLLAVAGAFVLIIHDLLPPDALGTAKFIVEGSVAITFVTLLVLLTGGADSPFFYAYPLIVAGAALVVTPRVTLVLAAIASLGYVAATLAAPDVFPPPTDTIATVGINLTALILLAYVAMVVAREQRRSRDAAIRLSTIDSLTGLFNRALFFAAVEREIARSARSGRGFCLVMMDLDGLKAVNDRFGHFVGDRVLRGVGEVIQGGVRRIDTPARYGGDEFVLLLPETDPTGAFVLAEKIRQEVAELAFNGFERDVRTSLSIGVVAYPDDGKTADELMISADQAMYASKRQGKNRVIDYASARAGGLSDRSM